MLTQNGRRRAQLTTRVWLEHSVLIFYQFLSLYKELALLCRAIITLELLILIYGQVNSRSSGCHVARERDVDASHHTFKFRYKLSLSVQTSPYKLL